MIVRLSYADVLGAGHAGLLRAVSNLFKRRPERYGADNGVAGYGKHDLMSCCAELAVAKAFNLYWPPPLDDFSARDVGGILDVRSTERDSGRLILHPHDDSATPFVLAVLSSLPEVRLAGWIVAADGKQTAWWADPSGKNRPAFFVPREALRPMEEFGDWLATRRAAA